MVQGNTRLTRNAQSSVSDNAALIEAARRLGTNYRIELEARLFFNVDSANPLVIFKQDSLVTLRLSRYF